MSRALETLERLVGTTVVSADLAQGQFAIRLEGGWRLTIYNRFVISSVQAEREAASPKTLPGNCISGVTLTHDHLKLELTDGSAVEIDLRDEAYTGPEAMMLVDPSGEIMASRGED
jgi:hypothetical protein